MPNFADSQEKTLEALYDRLELKVVTENISDRAVVEATLNRMCVNLMQDKVNGIRAMAVEAQGDFDAARQDTSKPSMIDKYPKACNFCGGAVIYTSNAVIYGREYGNGRCYLCTECGTFVGTHRPWPREALGLLADARMRKGKKLCHELFDPFWRGKPKAQKKRRDLYF